MAGEIGVSGGITRVRAVHAAPRCRLVWASRGPTVLVVARAGSPRLVPLAHSAALVSAPLGRPTSVAVVWAPAPASAAPACAARSFPPSIFSVTHLALALVALAAAFSALGADADLLSMPLLADLLFGELARELAVLVRETVVFCRPSTAAALRCG